MTIFMTKMTIFMIKMTILVMTGQTLSSLYDKDDNSGADRINLITPLSQRPLIH
jgi:hypothetical protein